MTREEAIEHGKEQLEIFGGDHAEFIRMAIEALEQEPCEDCVSRADLISKLEILERRYGSDFYWETRKIIDKLSPVTPQPKTGHWIGRKEVGFREWEDVTVLVNLEGCVTDSVECSECGNWLTGSDEYECDATYCPNCGAKMEGTE